MLDAPGVGLAAPQIGVGLRVFTYHVDDQLGHLINPSLDLSPDEETDDEGCLSFPGLVFPVKRAYGVVAKGFNMHGEPVTLEGSGHLARCPRLTPCSSRGTRWRRSSLGRMPRPGGVAGSGPARSRSVRPRSAWSCSNRPGPAMRASCSACGHSRRTAARSPRTGR